MLSLTLPTVSVVFLKAETNVDFLLLVSSSVSDSANSSVNLRES